jgi:hypothetical protein
MTEAAAGGGRAGIERGLIEKSLQDESFRQRLLEDPKATMEQELGVRLPAEMKVQAVEETTDTIYLVLPSASAVGEGGELSDQELESVAGGGIVFQTPTLETCNYSFTCHCD